MFLIFGCFWGAAMALPLFLTGSLMTKADLPKNILIMGALYVSYVCLRILYFLTRSIRWAYLVSNFFFTSDKEKRMAEEWLLFILFFCLWSVIMVYPLYLIGMWREPSRLPLALLILVAPYLGYLSYRALMLFLRSIKWAVKVSVKPR